MERKPINDPTLERHLEQIAPDSLEIFFLERGAIRGTILNGTRLVNEMRQNHDLGILETYVLGQAYIAVGLMTSMIKGNDRVLLNIECGGPIEGLTVEANARGEVRGYLRQVPIPLDGPLEDLDLSPFFGPGFLSVTRYLEDAKQPFTGQVMMEHGNMARDLAHYYLASEQIRTSFTLSVHFDRAGRVIGAGGLFLQVMPGAEQGMLEHLEDAVRSLPGFGRELSEGRNPRDLVTDGLAGFDPQHLASRPVVFACRCSKERFGTFIGSLPADERKSILEEGPFPLRTTCHNCNSTYEFHRNELQQLFSN